MTLLEALGLAYLICAVVVVGALSYCAGHKAPAWLAQDDPYDEYDLNDEEDR